jgi:hypothetical protein
VTLGVLDRSGCGAVLLLAVSLNYIDLLDSGKEIFWEFSGKSCYDNLARFHGAES